MAPELFEEKEEDDENDENKSDTKYTNKVDVYSFGITLIYIVTEKYLPFSLKNLSSGVSPKLKGPIVGWVRELIHRCISLSPDDRPSFAEILEIMKSHNYDMFNEIKGGKMTSKQRSQKKEIEKRILKIEAFEYQHQDE